METLMKQWAENYAPLTLKEQNELLGTLRDDEKLETLLKHNSRLIILIVNKWRNSFEDINDAYSIAIEACHNAYNKFNPDKYKFGNHCALYISAKLHRQWRRYSISDCSIDQIPEDSYDDSYSDISGILDETMTSVLSDDEMTFIRNIYYKNMSVGEAGEILGYKSIQSTSRKHRQIIEKLYVNTDKELALYID